MYVYACIYMLWDTHTLVGHCDIPTDVCGPVVYRLFYWPGPIYCRGFIGQVQYIIIQAL